MNPRGLVILDRDGVLNAVVVDAEHGTIDSPLHPSQVEILPGVPEALARLSDAGFGLCIASNQPAAAKGKTTLANLQATHATIVAGLGRASTAILSSHLCFHRSEDGCACRKPKPGLLIEALERSPQFDRQKSWMVGDGVTDVAAGIAAGVQTAFLGARKCDACKIFEQRAIQPQFWGPDLGSFVDYLVRAQP